MAKSQKHDNPATGGSRRAMREGLAGRSSAALSDLGSAASARIDSTPLVALAGGLALGAIFASLLPQTEREAELLEPVGSKVTDAGRASLDKVREAGRAKVDELAGDKLRELFGSTGSSSAST